MVLVCLYFTTKCANVQDDIYNYDDYICHYFMIKARKDSGFQSVEKVLIPMNGIPKGLCSFGRVQRQRLWWGVGQSPTNSLKALRKGWIKKQSSGLFFKRERLASEGVPLKKMGFIDKLKSTFYKCSYDGLIMTLYENQESERIEKSLSLDSFVAPMADI